MPSAAPETTRPSSGRRVRQRVALVLGAMLVGLLAIEGFARVRNYLKHGVGGELFEYVVDEPTGLRIPKPGAHGNIVCDSHGFRSPEIALPKPEGTTRVAFLGGSTTFCAEVSSTEATWPHLAVEALRDAHADRPFDYVNASAPGWSSEHSLTNLRARVAPLQPDVVVIYHLTNDMTRDARALAVEQGLWSEDEDTEDWLEKWSLAWSLVKKNFLIRDRGADDEPSGVLEFDAVAMADRFEQEIEKLVRAAQEVAPIVAIATFSHRVRPEQSAEERRAACQSALYYAPFLTPDGILGLVTAYNDAIRRVAAHTGAVLVDGENDIPADGENFNDSVHLTDVGCQKMAERVATAVLAHESLRTEPR